MREVKLVASLFLLGLCLQAGAQSGGNSTGEGFSAVDVAAAALGAFVGGIVVGVLSTLAISCIVYNQYCCKGRTNPDSKKYIKSQEAELTEVYNLHRDGGSQDENDIGDKEYEFLPLELERKKSKKGPAHHVELAQQKQPIAIPPPPSSPPPNEEPTTLSSPPLATGPPSLATTSPAAKPEDDEVCYTQPEIVVPHKQKKPTELHRKKEKKGIPLAPITVKTRQGITSAPIPPPQAAKPKVTSPRLDPELDVEYMSSQSEHYYVMDANKTQGLHNQQRETSVSEQNIPHRFKSNKVKAHKKIALSHSDISGSGKHSSLPKSVSADLKAIHEDNPDYINVRTQVKPAIKAKKKPPLIPQKSSAQASFKEQDMSFDTRATKVPLSASANQLFDTSFNPDPYIATPSVAKDGGILASSFSSKVAQTEQLLLAKKKSQSVPRKFQVEGKDTSKGKPVYANVGIHTNK